MTCHDDDNDDVLANNSKPAYTQGYLTYIGHVTIGGKI